MPTSTDIASDADAAPCILANASGASPVVLVCEHASNRIPAEFGRLGLDDATLASHIAWDPGALGVAQALGAILDAKLVHSTISRLVYDCNRPPEAPDSIPAKSEVYAIPGNQTLDAAARARRIEAAYRPFQHLLAQTLAATPGAVIVTVHSFTPVYFDRPRATEIGILHDTDSLLADEMLKLSAEHLPGLVERNQPYGPADGVTHTLKEHALKEGRLNVMLEIRNDLIATAAQQASMAGALAKTLTAALANLGIKSPVKVSA
ncbi:MAG: N-formylglutamate amidohydrolase [Paracoccaceae bacterium]